MQLIFLSIFGTMIAQILINPIEFPLAAGAERRAGAAVRPDDAEPEPARQQEEARVRDADVACEYSLEHEEQ